MTGGSERSPWRDRCVVVAYKTGYAVAHRLSPRISHVLARGAGWIMAPLMRDKRKMLERHLRRVDPSISHSVLRRASRNALASYARYYLESFRLPRMNAERVNATFTTHGFEHVTAGLAAGNGVILALPHLGGWEWAGRWMTDRGHAMNVVVEPLQPKALFEWFAGLRTDLGMKVMPLGPTVATDIAAALRRNEVVCLLCDRDIQRNGLEVTMFGEVTTLPSGPALMSLRTGAALLPVAVYFTDDVDGHHAVVRPPLTVEPTGKLRTDVGNLTQTLAGELESLIAHAPEQWHLLQPNWPSDPGYELPSTE